MEFESHLKSKKYGYIKFLPAGRVENEEWMPQLGQKNPKSSIPAR
jgi:hypothetical protein